MTYNSSKNIFKNKKIRTSSKEEIEPHEILLDSLAKKREADFGLSEKRFEVPIFKKNLQLFFLFCFLAIFFLFARTFQFQVVEAKKFSDLANENKFAIRKIQAERGVIYDKNMNQLVSNKPSFDLVVNINDIKDDSQRNNSLLAISKILNKDYQELKNKIEQSEDQKIFLAENLDYQTLIMLEARISEFPGFEIENNTVREYTDGPIFSGILGYQRKNGEETGLEKSYDEFLNAKGGELQIERDAFQNPISKKVISMPESGQSLVLWLDPDLQKKLTEALNNSLINTGTKVGAAVALDPKTGGVLAMVSLPNFDNNPFSQEMSSEDWQKVNSDPNNPLFNRVFDGIGFPTGSIIKPLIALAALEEGIVEPDTKLDCPVQLCIQNPWYPDKQDCFNDWKYHGPSDMRRALAESVNTYFYQIGGGYENFKGLGAKKIKQWLATFNWGSTTGIDLPQEGNGVLPDLEKGYWRIGDTYHFSIGQGAFSATPLQVATAYAAFANGGKLYKPQIVKSIINSEKNLVKEFDPQIIKTIPASPDNLEVVREGMRQGVSSPDGSSYILNSLPVKVASKTGTAQTGKRDVAENKDYLDSWTSVFAPYDDPQIVLTVIVQDEKEGQMATLPVAKEVLDWYFTQKNSSGN